MANKPHTEHSEMMVTGGYTVKRGDDLQVCVCCGTGIRHVVTVQSAITPGKEWLFGRDCTATHTVTSAGGIPGLRARTNGRRFLTHEAAAKLS